MTSQEQEELIEYLERDQLVQDTSRPLPPAPLGRVAAAALWVLRVFALVMAGLVIYTFVASLG